MGMHHILFLMFLSLSDSQSEIKIISTTVFVDPYEEADAQVRMCLFTYVNVCSTQTRARIFEDVSQD